MAYFNITVIKNELGITDTNSDSQLNTLGADADDYVNSKLAPYFSTPVSSPDNNIVDASNMGTISRYLRAIAQFEKAMEYQNESDRYINQYIRQQLLQKLPSKVPQYFVTTTGNFSNENNTP